MRHGKNPQPRKKLKKIKFFSYQIEEYIPLPKLQNNTKPLFFDVLDARKSERQFRQLPIQQISNLLWHFGKIKKVSISSDGQILSHSAAPSAGAIHPIDVFISLPDDLKKRALYYYDPFTHKLGKLKLNKQTLFAFLNCINKCLNIESATIIWLGACAERTEVKYKNFESLVWRDAGAVIMTIQLVAIALNIHSCPVGTLGNPFLKKLLSKYGILSAGGILVG